MIEPEVIDVLRDYDGSMTAFQGNLYPNNVVLRIGEPSFFGLSESPRLCLGIGRVRDVGRLRPGWKWNPDLTAAWKRWSDGHGAAWPLAKALAGRLPVWPAIVHMRNGTRRDSTA